MDDIGSGLTERSSATISNHSSKLPSHSSNLRSAQKQEGQGHANEDVELPSAAANRKRKSSTASSDAISDLRSSQFGDMEGVMDEPQSPPLKRARKAPAAKKMPVANYRQSPPLTRARRALADKKMPVDNYRDPVDLGLGLANSDTNSDTVGPDYSPQLPHNPLQGAGEQYQWAREGTEEDVDLGAQLLPRHLPEDPMNYALHQPQHDSDLVPEQQKAEKFTETHMPGLGITLRSAASQPGLEKQSDRAVVSFVVQQNGSSSRNIDSTSQKVQPGGTKSVNDESEQPVSDDFDKESACGGELRYQYSEYLDLTEEELAFFGEDMLKQSDSEMRGTSPSLNFPGFPEELEPDPLATINSYITGPQERRPTKSKSQVAVVDLTSSPQRSLEPESIWETFHLESHPNYDIDDEEFRKLIDDDDAYVPSSKRGNPMEGLDVSLATTSEAVIKSTLDDSNRKVIQPPTATSIPAVGHFPNESSVHTEAAPKVVIEPSLREVQDLSQASSNMVVLGSSPTPPDEFSDDAMDLDDSDGEALFIKGSWVQPVPSVKLSGPAPALTKEKPKLKSTYKKEPYRVKPADIKFSQRPQQRHTQSLQGPIASTAWRSQELSTYNGYSLPPRPAASSHASGYHTYSQQPPVLHNQPHGPDGLRNMSPVGIDNAGRSRGGSSGSRSSNVGKIHGLASKDRSGMYPTAFNPQTNALGGSPMRQAFSSTGMAPYPTMSMNSNPGSTAGGPSFTQPWSGGQSKKYNQPNPLSVQPNSPSVQRNPSFAPKNSPAAREYVNVQFSNTANLQAAHVVLLNAGRDGVCISVSGLTLRVVGPGGSGVRPWVRGLVPMGRIKNAGMC